MVDLVLGIAAAVGASTLYSLGIALQAMDAREAPREEHLRVALVWGLLRRARWMMGTGLSILGWPLQVVALLLEGLASWKRLEAKTEALIDKHSAKKP